MTQPDPPSVMAATSLARPMGRRLAMAAVALTAAGAGAWYAARRHQMSEPELTSFWEHSFPAPDGTTLALASLRGRPLLVNFWATWCAPCRVEMPSLARLPELFGEDRVVVVGLNVKEGPRAVSLFLQRTGVQMPVWMDPQGEITRAWGVSVYPTTFILDRQGRMRQRIRGEVDWSASEPLAWLDRWMDA